MDLKRIAKIAGLLFLGSQIPSFVKGFKAGYNNTDGYNQMTFQEKIDYAQKNR